MASVAVVLIAVFSQPIVIRNLQRLFQGPGYDDSTLVTIDRDTVHYNGYGTVTPALISLWRKSRSFESMLTLERWAFADGVHAERLSPGVLELTGVAPWRGTLPAAGDDRAAVLAYSFAQGDASWIGRTIRLGFQEYRVAAIMPPRFRLISRESEIWVPLPKDAQHLEIIGKLRPGVSPGAAQGEMRALSLAAKKWRARKLEVITLRENRQDDLWFAVSLLKYNFLFVFAVAIGAFIKFLREPMRTIPLREELRYLAFLLVKTLVLLSAMALCWILCADPGVQRLLTDLAGWAMPILFWMFLLTAWGLTFWSLRDQQNRCRTCCTRLRMPVESGLWSSLVLDRPRTEFICPYGHGTLYVPGTKLLDLDSINWTSNHDMWRELFDDGSVITNTN